MIRDEVYEFAKAIGNESDRGCVLLATSFIDDALESLLRTKLKMMSDVRDTELDILLVKRPLPPLGSFSIRTRVAAAMGILNRRTVHALRLLGDLRNKLAHQKGPAALDEASIAPIIQMLIERANAEGSGDSFKEALATHASRWHELLDRISKEIGYDLSRIPPLPAPSRERGVFHYAAGLLFAEIRMIEERLISR